MIVSISSGEGLSEVMNFWSSSGRNVLWGSLLRSSNDSGGVVKFLMAVSWAVVSMAAWM